jgi:hypothetical protein
MYLVGCYYANIYHDARSTECHTLILIVTILATSRAKKDRSQQARFVHARLCTNERLYVLALDFLYFKAFCVRTDLFSVSWGRNQFTSNHDLVFKTAGSNLSPQSAGWL